MTQQPFSSAALRGAVDLGAIAAAGQRRAAAAEGGGSAYVVEVGEADFQSAVINRSMTVPVVVDLWTARAAQSQQLGAVLDKLAAEYAGRFLLARVDIDTNPALVQAFQVQTLPFVVAVVKGQPLPLIADVLPEAAVRQVLDRLLEVAAQNGLTGRVSATGEVTSAAEGENGSAGSAGSPAAPEPPPLPPLHQAAYDAIEADDLEAAVAAYEQALRENPADDLASVGLVNVRLMQRVAGAAVTAAVAAADAEPQDTQAQLAAADAEFVTGNVDAAFDRLVEAVRVRSGDEREQVRQRLVDLFALLGPEDPQVRRARVALTNALF